MTDPRDPQDGFAATRRSFLKLGAILAGATGAGGLFSTPQAARASTPPLGGDPLDDDSDVRIVYTTCQMCHSRCGLKAKVWNGQLVKLDGNPYNPTNTEWQDGTHAATLDYATDPTLPATRRLRGRVCAKAQAGVETLYSPTRLRVPLKRVGPRGGGKWEAITWPQAIREIVSGGLIDNDDGTSYAFAGLKALRDAGLDGWIGGTAYHGADVKAGAAHDTTPSTATTLVDKVGGLVANAYANMDLALTAGTGAGQVRRLLSNTATTFTIATPWLTIPDATTTYAARAGDLGREANMVIYSPGRQPPGNSNFTDRLWRDAFGTANFRIDHTSICETSHHVATNLQTSDSRMGQAGKNAVAPDVSNADCVAIFGENPAEASFPHQSYARKLVDALHRPVPLRCYVVDPRLSRTAAIVRQCGGTWVAPRPGTDGAIALGMIAWMLENALNEARAADPIVQYLRLVNRRSAADAAEPNFTDACYLVVRTTTDATIAPGEFLDAGKLGSGAGAAKDYVAVVGGTPTAIDPDSTTQAPGQGMLDVDGIAVATTGGTASCDSVYHLLKLQALAGAPSAADAVAHWAGVAGIDPAIIVQMAKDFVAAGRRAVASHYRGSVQHTNGTHTSMAINALNWLVGSLDRRGGGQIGASYSEGSPPFRGAKIVPLGPRIDRAGKNHTDVPTFFARGPDGGRTPTRRAWFPFAQNGNFQELVPSIGGQYPYGCKAFIQSWNAWNYSVPAGKAIGRAVMLDTARVPLHVAIDVQLGELTALADYVLPEVTALETYATPKIPHSLQKEGCTRIPVVGKYYIPSAAAYRNVSEVTDFSTIAAGDEAYAVWGRTPYFVPIFPETRQHADIFLHMMIGPEGVSPGNDATASSTNARHLGGLGTDGFAPGEHLFSAWDFFRRLFLSYQAASPTLAVDTPNVGATAMARTSNMLLRGGRFDAGDGTSGDFMTNLHGSLASPKIVHFYAEPLTTKVNSQTGRKDWPGIPTYRPVQDARGAQVTDAQFPLQLITFKLSWHGQARTVVNPTLLSLAPENSVWINAADAAAAGIKLGDRVRVSSASDPAGAVTRAFVTQGIAPGVVAVSHHFGHWELGSRAHVVSGASAPFDARRGAGITPNPLMRLDPVFGDVTLQDVIGGSASFFDTRVKVERV